MSRLARGLVSLPAALLGSTTATRLNMGAPTGSVNMTAFSVAALVRVDTWTGGRSLFAKTSGAGGWSLTLNATVGELDFNWGRATTALLYTTNTTPINMRQWQWVCVSMNKNASANALVQIYTRTVDGPLIAAGFSTTQDGTGAYNSDSGNNLAFGNTGAGSPSLALQGAEALGFLNTTLAFTYQDWLQFTDDPFFWSRFKASGGFWRMGELGRGSGTGPGIADESGQGFAGIPAVTVEMISGPTIMTRKKAAPVVLAMLTATGTSLFGAGYYMRRRRAA